MRRTVAGALALVAGLLFGMGDGGLPQVPQARAIIGAPWTPMSYAGVARRTTRRAAYVGATGYYATAPVVAPVATLPSGCVKVVSGGVMHYECGGTAYRPVYDGPNVVYVVE